MQNFAKTELKLTALCLAIFTAVLVSFAFAVFSAFTMQIEEDSRTDLRRLADAVIASIDFDNDEEKSPASAEPDLIASAMPETSSQLLNAMKLEWFDLNGKLSASKGTFAISTPLTPREGFILQDRPRGISFTKPVFNEGKLLGFVRVGQPSDKQDRAVNNLKNGLIFGTLIALLLSGAGTLLIVRQSIAPIFNAIQKLRQFTSDASHELRNPIAAVLFNSGVALKHSDGMRPGDQEKFETIDECGRQMQRLVEKLLQLSRAEQLPDERYHANLNEAAQQAMAGLAHLRQSKGADIDIDIPAQFQIDCAADDLQRIISNLLENAIKYSTGSAVVQLRAVQVGTSALLSVEDKGIGIASGDIERVFDRFWRADKTRSHADHSEGLGLAIVKALVERYKGSISVQSELGKGSTFNVSLPLSQKN